MIQEKERTVGEKKSQEHRKKVNCKINIRKGEEKRKKKYKEKAETYKCQKSNRENLITKDFVKGTRGTRDPIPGNGERSSNLGSNIMFCRQMAQAFSSPRLLVVGIYYHLKY